MADRGLTGVLLVGGASRRFGSPKALARLDGETLAERGWRVLGGACEERIAVGKEADALPLLAEKLARGDYSLRDVPVTVVELDPRELANVNTSAELAALQPRSSGSTASP